MFQIYKKRNFTALISDTFEFFKLEGKNYFKNYFTINGPLFLLLIVLIYFFSQLFLEGAFASLKYGNDNLFLENLYSNMTLFIAFGSFMVLLIFLLSILNYTFPVAYLHLMTQNKPRTTLNLGLYLKAKIGRILLFYILSIFVMVPLLLLVFIVTLLSFFIVVGIPLIFIIFPTITSFVALTYYHFVSEEIGYFNAIGKAISMLKSNFWNTVGSSFVMLFIIQTVMGIVTLIPYFIGMVSVFTNAETSELDQEKTLSTVYILVLCISIIAIVFNYTLQNLVLVNQGIIYYSGKENIENFTTKNNIDLIGTHEA